MLLKYQDIIKNKNVLSFIESTEIYNNLLDSIDLNNQEEAECWEDFILSCIDYSEIRSKWILFSREEKLNKDNLRTSIHNRVITNLNIIKRLIERRNGGIEWFNHFNEDRKRIGDFAVYLNYISGLNNR